MLSPPPLISTLVYNSCLTHMRLSIRFSVSMRFFCSSFTTHRVTCTRRWIETLVNLVFFISLLFCYKLLSVRRIMGTLHCSRMFAQKNSGLNTSPQALSESKTTIAMLSSNDISSTVIVWASGVVCYDKYRRMSTLFWTLTFISIALA